MIDSNTSSVVRFLFSVVAIGLLVSSATAFVQQEVTSSAMAGSWKRRSFQPKLYYLPSTSNNKEPQQNDRQEGTTTTNEWGIPASSDLPPLGPADTKPLTKTLPNGGRITLLGSGPGDPELLTMAAYRLLTEDPKTLVIADRLVSPEIIDMIKGEVKRARKLPGCAELAQEELYWWAYQGLKEGRHVIRLKIGDPFVFGRGGEEVLKFRAFGVEPTVIPVSDLISWFRGRLVFKLSSLTFF